MEIESLKTVPSLKEIGIKNFINSLHCFNQLDRFQRKLPKSLFNQLFSEGKKYIPWPKSLKGVHYDTKWNLFTQMDTTFSKEFTFFIQNIYCTDSPLLPPTDKQYSYMVIAKYGMSVCGKTMKFYRFCFKCIKLYIETNNLNECANICRYYEFIPLHDFRFTVFRPKPYLKNKKNWCNQCLQTTLFEILPSSECQKMLPFSVCKGKYGVPVNPIETFASYLTAVRVEICENLTF